jgi:transcriptional regulator with XRE-family HTH domain
MAMVSPLGAFGDRIAALRVERGWTQQELADRLAMSRTALSHLEAGMRVSSERTVVILAGIFGIDPHALVDGTTYPLAKAERLPMIAALHTEVDLALALAAAEISVAERSGNLELLAERCEYWSDSLGALERRWPDRVDRERLRTRVNELLRALRS